MALAIPHKDRKIAAGGACAALVVGLLLGGLMHPNLAADDRPAGPQMILGKAAERSTGPFDPSPANYAGGTPEYVLGTDWTRAQAPQTAEPPPRAQRIVLETDEPRPPAVYTIAAYDPDDPPAPRRHRYPTLGDRVEPRAPIGQAVDDAAEERDPD